jgi:hypothetical protein
MAAAGYIVEVVFGALGIIPTSRAVSAISEGPSWNYTTVLNIVFLVIAAVLVVRFLRTGGQAMLRMMNTPEDEMAQHDHAVTGHSGHEGHDVRTTAMEHADHSGYVAGATEQTGSGRAGGETTLVTDISGYEEHTTHETS